MSKIYIIILLGIIVIVGLILFIICKCNKKMKIIMLAGNENTGKTTTLIKVYEQLSKKNKRPTYIQKIVHKNKSLVDKEYYPLKRCCKKIALCTAGDCWDYIKESIIKYNCIGADVLIIAFSENKIKEEMEKNKNNGKLIDKVEEELYQPIFLENIKPHRVIHKTVTGDPNALPTDDENNEKNCQEIIDCI